MTTFPTIHLNGTSKQELLDGYIEALRAVEDAAEALRKIEFNARDYYVQGPNAWSAAREERSKLYNALNSVTIELSSIAINIVNQ